MLTIYNDDNIISVENYHSVVKPITKSTPRTQIQLRISL